MHQTETTLLASVNHPNINVSFGHSNSEERKYIVTRWAENGTLKGYLKNNPHVDRLALLCGIASAVTYLHTLPDPIIHGDIHPGNILVSERGDTLLSDFGLGSFLSAAPSSPRVGYDMGSIAGVWACIAPDLYATGICSLPADVFAFGTLIFYVYAGKMLFADFKHLDDIREAICSGRRPSRTEITRCDFQAALWTLVQACWSDNPGDRPTMPDVNLRLHTLLYARGGSFLDCAALKGHTPIARGGFSNVYKIVVPNLGCFALKCITAEQGPMQPMLQREIMIHTSLMHPNIVPIVSFSEPGQDQFIFSSWAEHGTLGDYLREHPNADRLKLLHGVSSGLRYLHAGVPRVIHGDICPDNVLVYSGGNARLSDFGQSALVSPRLADESSAEFGAERLMEYDLTRARYMSPELHDEHQCRSPETDVFAFGMLSFYVYAGKPPFANLDNDNAIVLAVWNRQRPARTDITRDDFQEPLWELMQACWSHEPKDRPSMLHAQLILEAVILARGGWQTAPSAGDEGAGTLIRYISPLSRAS
ncbi:kinase-like protein [Auricularia subglabra TFB-10046 SS5]|nr:kinase-like protein [Auricularia subglabra TFB-10046 SS5]